MSEGSDQNITLKSSRFHRWILGVLYLTLCFSYIFLPNGDAAFPWFGGIYTLQFIVFAAILFYLRTSSSAMTWVLFLSISARLILLFTEPVLENDYWRYLWDGRVLANGISPYQYKPLDPALDHLDVFYRNKIGWKQYGTIYPPLAIFLFALAHKIAADSLLALKGIFIIFDLGTGFILYAWLKRLKINPIWSAIYFLNPLVLKEIANSSHLDSAVVFFTTLSVYLFWKSKAQNTISLFGWLSLAAATAIKYYPICLVPLFFKVDSKRWRGLAAFLALNIFVYLPFLDRADSFSSGPQAFARHWIFNAGLYRAFQKMITYLVTLSTDLAPSGWAEFALQNDRITKVIVGLVFLMFVLYRTRKLDSVFDLPKECLYILGGLLILSPVVNPWYVLWLLPFAVIMRSPPWLLFTFLVVASYSWLYSKELAFYLRWIEYITFFAVFLIHHRTQQKVIADEPRFPLL